MSRSGFSLYVHVPWCERKCPYCDFNSHALPTGHTLDPEIEQAYVLQLLNDLDLDLESHNLSGEIDTLFIGGGTPSLFSSDAIDQLLTGIHQRLPIASHAECTLEANPGSSDQAKFARFRAAGINRLSLGIQSFFDIALTALGRVHHRDEAIAAIESARAAGFNNINLDLMYGLPGQLPDDALKDLAEALNFRPEHISWYQLTIEPNTVFYRMSPSLPHENLLLEIDKIGLQCLKDHGYQRYEVSAFARSPQLRSKHNLNYWQFGDYLGIGAGAHGKITNHAPHHRVIRTQKTRAPQHYLAAVNPSQRQIETQDLPLEFLMNGLRLVDGFLLSQFEATTRLPVSTLDDFIKAGESRGWLTRDNGQLRATPRGYHFLDSLLTLI